MTETDRTGRHRVPGDTPARARPGLRRVYWVSFGLSALLHVVAVLLYPFLVDRPDPREAIPGPLPPLIVQGTRLLQLTEIPPPAEEVAEPEPEPEREEEVEPDPEPVRLEATPVPTSEADLDPEENPDPLTIAERLRPRMTDARLFTPIDPTREAITEEERALQELYGRLQIFWDSIEAQQNAEQPNVDWTFTDGDGRKWGISPGKLHLGGITLPLPKELSTLHAFRRDDALLRQWILSEIERAASINAVHQTLKERGRVMRERADAERADTTRIRR